MTPTTGQSMLLWELTLHKQCIVGYVRYIHTYIECAWGGSGALCSHRLTGGRKGDALQTQSTLGPF